MATTRPIVYIVHCVDAEGPLDESLEATFERIQQIFGITLEPKEANLHRLRLGELDLGERTEAVRKLLEPKLFSYKRSWDEIDEMLDPITKPGFRETLPDSFGNGWAYSWFCVDHVGYESNPRKRDLGYHRVFDHYHDLLEHDHNRRDRLFFHYHPLPHNRMAHSCATFYFNGNHLFEILARKVIDRRWFPSVFRPGFHVTRPDSNWFMEQWIPFDYANQATTDETDQPDLASGRFGDWRRAPHVWGAYHPSHDDYQIPGRCHRWIFRCLNLGARLRSLTSADVERAFRQAEEVGSAVLAFTNHDFRDMTSDVESVRRMIGETAAKRPLVRFAYVDALTAARRHLNLPAPQSLGLEIQPRRAGPNALVMEVSANGPLYGPQPFLAIRDKGGRYWHDNFDFNMSPGKWHYTFDWQTCAMEDVDVIGVAGVGFEGQTEVALFNPENGTTKVTCHNLE